VIGNYIYADKYDLVKTNKLISTDDYQTGYRAVAQIRIDITTGEVKKFKEAMTDKITALNS